MDKEELEFIELVHDDFKKQATPYFTHDNGGRPFLVFISHENKTANVFRCAYKKPPVLVKQYEKIDKPFIGCDSSEPLFAGNSILFKLYENLYAFVGHTIYEFETKEEILEYYSIVGNSDVPYPVAVGADNAYFMLDKVFVSKTHFLKNENWEDGYTPFYNLKKKTHKKMNNVNVIHERFF
eukprot:gene3302-5743_t